MERLLRKKRIWHREGVAFPELFAVIFSIGLGLIIFFYIAPMTYGGQKAVNNILEAQQMQLEAEQELRTMLQSPLFPQTQDNPTAASLIESKITFAELIDMIGYDPQNRQAYLSILRSQVHAYLDAIGNPARYRMKVSFKKPAGSFQRERNDAPCDTAFCILPYNPKGDVMVGEITYPSLDPEQLITVRLLRSKTVAPVESPPPLPAPEQGVAPEART